jgi:hypothetical protein
MSIKYLLDEHISPIYRTQLLKKEPDLIAFIIGDPGAPPKGAPDPDILHWCEDNGFALVTNNRRSMPRHLAAHLANGNHVPGIFIVKLDDNVGNTVDQLVLIAGASLDDEYQDTIIHLPVA